MVHFLYNFPLGSKRLEKAIDDVVARVRGSDLQVFTEDVPVTRWKRGEEYAQILQPYRKNIHILGLGDSASTPPEGVIARVVVVHDFDELQERADEVLKSHTSPTQ